MEVTVIEPKDRKLFKRRDGKVKPKVYYTMPAVRRVAELARDLDDVPILARRPNGRIQAVCGMAVSEFYERFGIELWNYYRLVGRKDNTKCSIKYPTLVRIANAINLAMGSVLVDAQWVVANMYVTPPGAYPSLKLKNSTRARFATRATMHALNAMEVMRKYNEGEKGDDIGDIVRRRMTEPITVEDVIKRAFERTNSE